MVPQNDPKNIIYRESDQLRSAKTNQQQKITNQDHQKETTKIPGSHKEKINGTPNAKW